MAIYTPQIRSTKFYTSPKQLSGCASVALQLLQLRKWYWKVDYCNAVVTGIHGQKLFLPGTHEIATSTGIKAMVKGSPELDIAAYMSQDS